MVSEDLVDVDPGLKRDFQSLPLIDFQRWFRSQARNHRCRRYQRCSASTSIWS